MLNLCDTIGLLSLRTGNYVLCSTHAYQILSAVFYSVNQNSEVSTLLSINMKTLFAQVAPCVKNTSQLYVRSTHCTVQQCRLLLAYFPHLFHVIAAYPANRDVNEGEKRLQLPSETFKKWPLLVGRTSAIC